MESPLLRSANTLSTSFLSPSPTSASVESSWQEESSTTGTNIVINIRGNDGSTGKGILIGMLSAFGSAAFVVLVFAVFYFFWYTRPGRIFLDRIGRPGEFDDEQTFAREESRALEEMDDLQRLEYLRAKGMIFLYTRHLRPHTLIEHPRCSFHRSQSARNPYYRYHPFTIPRHPRKRRFRMGIRTRA